MRVKAILTVIITMMVFSGCSLPKFSLFPEEGPLKETTLQGSADQKILVISINGVISDQPEKGLLRTQPSMVQEVVAQLRRAAQDPQIKAVLLKINSPGGTVTASDIIYHELIAFKKKTRAKLVVSMMDVTASGGYYVSLPAEWIMAHPTTVTGSVGVIFARPGVSGFMEKAGLRMEVSTSGKLKDMGSPFRPPTEEERAIFKELTNGLADRFLELVAEHRRISPQQREKIATARVFLADDAKALGLVDQVGYLNDAIEKARELAGLPPDARVIVYRRQVSEDDTIYNPTVRHVTDGGNALVPPILKPLSNSSEAGFYYLWPAALAD